MGKYIIRTQVAPGGGYSEREYVLDKQLEEGIEADGFVLLLKNKNKPDAIVIHDVTIMDLAQLLSDDGSSGVSEINQAFAIAEGINKATEIKRNHDREGIARSLAEMLRAK